MPPSDRVEGLVEAVVRKIHGPRCCDDAEDEARCRTLKRLRFLLRDLAREVEREARARTMRLVLDSLPGYETLEQAQEGIAALILEEPRGE